MGNIVGIECTGADRKVPAPMPAGGSDPVLPSAAGDTPGGPLERSTSQLMDHLVDEAADEEDLHDALGEEQVLTYSQLFQRMDKSQAGYVDGHRFTTLLRHMFKASGAEKQELQAKFDVDGDGSVTRREFRRALTLLSPKYTKEEANRLFDELDLDKSGQLNQEELSRLIARMLAMDPATAADIIQRADGDGDGKISFLEFAKALHRTRRELTRIWDKNKISKDGRQHRELLSAELNAGQKRLDELRRSAKIRQRSLGRSKTTGNLHALALDT